VAVALLEGLRHDHAVLVEHEDAGVGDAVVKVPNWHAVERLLLGEVRVQQPERPDRRAADIGLQRVSVPRVAAKAASTSTGS
jgi:hypothetical protein